MPGDRSSFRACDPSGILINQNPALLTGTLQDDTTASWIMEACNMFVILRITVLSNMAYAYAAQAGYLSPCVPCMQCVYPPIPFGNCSAREMNSYWSSRTGDVLVGHYNLVQTAFSIT